MINTIRGKLKDNINWHPGGFKRYFFNTGWQFFSKISTLVVAFFANVIVVRYFGPQDYGLISYSINLLGIFSLLIGLGLDSVLYRELIKAKDEESGSLLGSAFTIKIAGALVALISLIIYILFFHLNDQLAYFVLIVSLSWLFQPIWVINGYFLSRVKSKGPTLLSLIIAVVLNILKILIVYLGLSVLVFAWVFVLEQVLYFLGFLYLYKKSRQNIRLWRFDMAKATMLLKDSWPLLFVSAFALIYNRIDQIMIGNMMNVTQVGYYDVGVRLSEFWLFIPALICSSLFPAIINSRLTSNLLYRKRMMMLYGAIFWSATVIALISFLFSNEIIVLLYGIKFLPSVIVLKIYTWAGVGVSIAIIAQSWLLAENLTKISFKISMATAMLNVVLNYFLIPSFGIYGAAFATLISSFMLVFSLLLFSESRSHFFFIIKSIFFTKYLRQEA